MLEADDDVASRELSHLREKITVIKEERETLRK